MYDRDYWWSDAWDPLDNGAEIDFSKTFAEQFDALMKRTPLVGIFNGKSENSTYCNHVGVMKDCYMTHASWSCERSLYSDMLLHSQDSMDCLQCDEVQQGYELLGCENCYNTAHSLSSQRCTDCWFLYNCKNCTDCIGCVNLSNKQFYIFNEPYSREEYLKKKQELQLDTRDGVEHTRERFQELRMRSVHRYAQLTACENTTGDIATNCSNSRSVFSLKDAQNCAYCINGGMIMKDTYDGYGVGAVLERGYYIFDTGDKGMENLFSGIIWGSSFVYYSYNCHTSYELFGCTGLRGKKFCILNKQYTEDEYKKMKARLIAHMRQTGEWGEFFPPSISPFGYNETLAHEYTPLTKEQAIGLGFKWQDALPGTFGKETLAAEAVPQRIADVDDSILAQVLACVRCKKNYKIVKAELDFYRLHGLPLPVQCPECRYTGRVAQRNPHQLWKRSCQCAGAQSQNGVYHNIALHPHSNTACTQEFETTLAPERSEIVYCDSCYYEEVQ